jgi:hypothetical protein
MAMLDPLFISCARLAYSLVFHTQQAGSIAVHTVPAATSISGRATSSISGIQETIDETHLSRETMKAYAFPASV